MSDNSVEASHSPEQRHDPRLLRAATIDAVLASMQIVKSFQMGEEETVHLDDKSDGSVVTAVDFASEAASKQVLQAHFPDVPILGEETGLSPHAESPFLFMVDPIDGTRPFISGASTSTVIASLFDRQKNEFISATIGEPSTGRIWHADGEQTVLMHTDGSNIVNESDCQVWKGPISNETAVLIENFRAFKRSDGRQILTNENTISLFTSLQSRVVIQNYGSNGMHHALVANGGERVAGSITTSMGGEWDTAGALAVINAGGVAEGYRMTPERTLESADPLNPFAYDILIAANNLESLDFLKQSLVHSLK